MASSSGVILAASIVCIQATAALALALKILHRSRKVAWRRRVEGEYVGRTRPGHRKLLAATLQSFAPIAPCGRNHRCALRSEFSKRSTPKVYAQEKHVGSDGGDQMVASSYSAFETSSSGVKGLVSGLTALVNAASSAIYGGEGGNNSRQRARVYERLGPDMVLEGLRADFVDRAYLWSGDITPELYDEDCIFTDPTLTFRGLSTYETNLRNLAPILDRLVPPSARNVQLKSIFLRRGCGKDGSDAIVADWRIEGNLALPWRPRLELDGTTTFSLAQQETGGRIFDYNERWAITAGEALAQLVRPAIRPTEAQGLGDSEQIVQRNAAKIYTVDPGQTPVTIASVAAAVRPPLPDDFYNMSPFDTLALALFRRRVQAEIGWTSAKEGYDGLVEEAIHYQSVADAEAQQTMVREVLKTLMGPAVPGIYRTFMAAPAITAGSGLPWAPFLTALFTPLAMGFLVGPADLADRKNVGGAGGVDVKRCRFLEETGCKGLCLNMCKLPAQQFFKDELGLDVTFNPNFETHECHVAYGVAPMDVAKDPTVPAGCLASCASADAKGTSRCAKVS